FLYVQECLIIVLDVRQCASEEFKLKSVKCIAEIIKDKIVGSRKDYVSFVLVGAERTMNDLNEKDENACLNVVQYPCTQLCTWQLLLSFYKFINETSSDEGQWLDGLAVAMSLQEQAVVLKCQRQRILLFFDFNHMPQQYEDYTNITNNLLMSGIELIVSTHNIVYIDNAENNEPQAIFQASPKASSLELDNQKHALQLVSHCNASLCNFKEALGSIFKITNRRPWVWNAKLHIGNTISLSLQGIIAMKNERFLKLEKKWAEDNEQVSREEHYSVKGKEISVLPEELIDGYMLGGTAVPYDDTLVEPEPAHPPGLHFVGFAKRSSIPDAYFCGDSLYMLVHQKGNTTSARKLDALVKAMLLQKSVIVGWKIYSAKLNKPRIVVLLPQEPTETRPAALYMLEMSYQHQLQFWDFPALRTDKTECSTEQLDAVDKLIDSMDLECTLKNSQQPRKQRQNDLLPFDQLPSIHEQNVMDVLERKVLDQNRSDKQFELMLRDKNFVDKFWRVPEAIEQTSKHAAKVVKALFPLEQSHAWLEKLKAREREENELPPVKQEQEESNSDIAIDCIGLVTPAQDYKQLLQKVRSITNTTQKDAQFQSTAAQMRLVILTLLDRKKLNLVELGELLDIYRKSCLEFNSFAEYNNFAAELKQRATERDLQEFWRIMVDQQLGPLVLGEPTLDDEIRLQAYYEL
ncbi:Ku80, partial [Drosophila busckii]